MVNSIISQERTWNRCFKESTISWRITDESRLPIRALAARRAAAEAAVGRVARAHWRSTQGGLRMIPKEFDAIDKEDIDVLVANAVSEGRTIEYKEQLPSGTDDDRREFLADASSFANAAGGDLIYGIREKRDANGKATGLPEAAEGLAGANANAEKRRLEEM